ncbi:uncharacterized protein LOC109858320 [Pseudomyrmex gracilis]|uniref:uncharacterized protein LOC109858320 n=1 Tax=Pseudomyrmex gracilis TaxID=219809 RepID=UPI000994E719|nr:uncharacterized protein LOC109858320 [Pseudomyrmex gracilis]
MYSKKFVCYLTLGLLLLGIFLEEVEARRKILRGRKTITRHYYRGLAIPAWAVSVLTGVGMLLIGGLLYALLQKFVVDAADTGETTHSYQPALQLES